MRGQSNILEWTDGKAQFYWDVTLDQAEWRLTQSEMKADCLIWKGGLLPAYELVTKSGSAAYVKANVRNIGSISTNVYKIELQFGHWGKGILECELTSWGLRFTQLETFWHKDTSVISLYFGTRPLSEVESTRTPRGNQTFWPDWSAAGYCVPAAGSSPTKSFWRSWDMGDATLPLGSFGDAMGTPYAAAFPRPLYAASMGGGSGWVAFGPGEVPDAPVSLQLQSATSCLHYLYREDLWPPSNERHRVLREPLRLCWGESGYDAFLQLYLTFGRFEPKSPHHQRSFLCTWGDFKEGRFDLQSFTKRAKKQTSANMIILDDYWETFNGSGVPDLQRFPNFEQDLNKMRESGFEIAFWQSIGWIDEPEQVGLTAEDLLCGSDGRPRQWTWSGNPLRGEGYHYCIDPSSERAREFIRGRTEQIVRTWNPVALKLDFGYGFPGPDVCVPRDPAYRGERLAVKLLELISEAAKAINPDITIIYYGIHPLLHDVSDLISIDDLGDAGDSPEYERIGHNQRCLWASLAASHGMALNTSTGYYWDAFGSILLDTAVVGSNGLTLGEFDANGKSMDAYLHQRWHALETWKRRTCGWQPLWLEADLGGLGGEPSIVSWGRREPCGGVEGTSLLTSIVLRNDSNLPKSYEHVESIQFTGSWAVISQDDKDIAHSRKVACIPFEAGTLTIDRGFTSIIAYRVVDGTMQPIKTDRYKDLESCQIDVTVDELDGISGFLILHND